MAESKKTSKTTPSPQAEPAAEPKWYLSGFALTERGITAVLGGLQDVRAEVVETLSSTIDFVDSTGQRGAKLAHRLLERADDFASTALGTAESSTRALLSRASKTSGDAAELAAKSAGDLAA